MFHLLLQTTAGNAILDQLACRWGKLSLYHIHSCGSLGQLLNSALLPGCTALSLSGERSRHTELEFSLAGCTQLAAIRRLDVVAMHGISLDAAALPALEYLSAGFQCTVSFGPAPLPALQSIGLKCRSASLDPAVVPQLQALTLGPCELSLLGPAAFTSLRSLHFSHGEAALLGQLLQRAPQLAELVISAPRDSDSSVAPEHLQVGPAKLKHDACIITRH